MQGYSSELWSDFALGNLGASAALLGLVFVGISINLHEIIKSTSLIRRAGESIMMLAFVLISSATVLIPMQSRDALGVEMIAIGTVLLVTAILLLRSSRVAEVKGYELVFRRVLSVSVPTCVLIAGISMLALSGGGLYWWAASVFLAYFSSLSGAWVLLVEILR